MFMGINLHDGRRKPLSQPSTRHGNPIRPLTLIGTVRYLEMRFVERSLPSRRFLDDRQMTSLVGRAA
ncbi:MAG: hypothetical protein B7Y65_03400 [Azorhizobium sp. 35-67-15]|nr:MAG: hypothetical protein B7Y65_03400 [Azorhizobium sp. 35-67-15]OZA84298.1 MAG: hypothetical protein B7X76_07095 [Azorhizobium sp. 39-67-5]